MINLFIGLGNAQFVSLHYQTIKVFTYVHILKHELTWDFELMSLRIKLRQKSKKTAWKGKLARVV